MNIKKKKNPRDLGKGTKKRRIKSKQESPNTAFLKWLKAEVRSIKPGDMIYLSFDKLMASVFTPAKITESSAFLYVNRLLQGRCVAVAELGKIVRTGNKGFSFIPHRPAAPVTASVKPIVGNPPTQPYHEWEGRLKSIESSNNLILLGLNALMKELGVSVTPTTK